MCPENSNSMKKHLLHHWTILFRGKRLKFDFFHALVVETERFELTKKSIRNVETRKLQGK
jgi:hypothetical protein